MDERKPPGHIFWVQMKDQSTLQKVLDLAKLRKCGFTTHYVPLHSSPYGSVHAKSNPKILSNTDQIYQTTCRLPIWYGMTDFDIDRVVNVIMEATNDSCIKE
jgi:dTDP-4-amino-4,6-dideoxygalactose transaminase